MTEEVPDKMSVAEATELLGAERVAEIKVLRQITKVAQSSAEQLDNIRGLAPIAELLRTLAELVENQGKHLIATECLLEAVLKPLEPEVVERLAHRTAFRYFMDEAGDLYTFNRMTLLDFAEKVRREGRDE